jgi:hypothetical protein
MLKDGSDEFWWWGGGRAGIMYDVVVPAAAPITESSVANLMQGQQQQQQNPNLMSMSGDNFGSAVSRSLELGGRSALALRLLLGAMSKRISSSAGVATGEEFRAARKAAEEIGAQIVLGDRPIEITVSSRTWNLETLWFVTSMVPNFQRNWNSSNPMGGITVGSGQVMRFSFVLSIRSPTICIKGEKCLKLYYTCSA